MFAIVLDAYLNRQHEVSDLLKRLSDAGKKMFLITNSGIPFVWVNDFSTSS